MRSLLAILFLCSAFSAKAQLWTEEEQSGRINLGLKFGPGFGSFYGKELKNPRPLLGFNAGLYLHGKDTLGKATWQTGLEARFRGGNFANFDYGNTAYTRIGLITIDVPMLLNINVQPGKKTGKYKALQVGLIGSYILRSVLYIGEDKIPQNRDNNLKTWKNLPFRPFDAQAMIGYQKRGALAGYQIGLKFGVVNLNKNFVLPGGTLPTTGTGKRIGTWNVDFDILF